MEDNKKRSFLKHYDIIRKRWLTDEEIEAYKQRDDLWSMVVNYFIILPVSLVWLTYCILIAVFAT